MHISGSYLKWLLVRSGKVAVMFLNCFYNFNLQTSLGTKPGPNMGYSRVTYLWASYLTWLSLGFPICKMGVTLIARAAIITYHKWVA